MMVSNKRHNLQNKIVQSTGLKKAWIGTIAILKGLKYKLSFWTSLKSKTQLIQTDEQTGTLKCWNVGIELSICDTTKSPPIYTLPQFLSMSENNCGIYWLNSCNSLTSHNGLKSSKQFTVSVSPFLLGDNFHSQILKKMSPWGPSYVSCQKKTFKNKIWLCKQFQMLVLVCFSQKINCLVLWHFGSVKSLE